MPRYEYQCQGCGKTVEIAIKVADRDTINLTCPTCGLERMERKPSSGSFTIKGYAAKNGYSFKDH